MSRMYLLSGHLSAAIAASVALALALATFAAISFDYSNARHGRHENSAEANIGQADSALYTYSLQSQPPRKVHLCLRRPERSRKCHGDMELMWNGSTIAIPMHGLYMLVYATWRQFDLCFVLCTC